MSFGRSRHNAIRAEQRRFRRAQAGKAWTPRDLPVFYYHKNFSDFTSNVHADFFDLLGADELEFLSRFSDLPFPAQCLYVRLANRRGYVFDVEKLDYPEIEAIDRQWTVLREFQFVEAVAPPLFRDWLNRLTKPDLVLLLSDHVCETMFRRSWKKDKLVDIALREIDTDDLVVPDRYIAQGRREALQYLFFLYFGRIEDNLQAFTLRDLGLVKPPEPSREMARRFDTPHDAKTAFFYGQSLHRFRHGNDHDAAELIGTVDHWPEPVCEISHSNRDKLLQKLGGWSERRGELDTALSLYDRSNAPLCNERVVRIRWKRDDPGDAETPADRDWAKRRLETMIDDPASDVESLFAQDFYARKFNKKRTSDTTDLIRAARTVTLDEAFRNQPERAALRHFKDQGVEGYRTENRPWRNLFGLLFWDLLHVEGESRRRLPTVLRSGTFYTDHTDAIEARLRALDAPNTVLLDLLKTLSKHFGEESAIVHWGSRSLDRIQALILHSPPGSAAHMLRLMAKNWRAHRDGFPDLMLIEEGQIRFVEVKTQGDSLRRNQLARMMQLRSAGYACDILRVDWAVDPDQIYVVVDVETTGGRPGHHRLTEIGAVKVRGGEVIGEYQTLINPQRSIPANITRITGITNEMVADAPRFIEIAEDFRAFMGNAIFAAHNVNFDYGFISAEYEMIDQRFRHPKICTCASMRRLYPGHRSYSLKNLCRDFEIDLTQHHRALCDAKAAAELLKLVNTKRMAE